MESAHKRKHGNDRDFAEDRKTKNARHNESREDQNKISSVERHQNSTDRISSNNKSRSSTSEIVAKLLKSLDDLLEDESKEHTRKILGNVTLDQCFALQRSLQTHNSSNIQSNSSSKTLDLNTPASISHLSVTPWTVSSIPKSLPALPEVFDPTLKAGAFIHQGVTGGKASDLSYERLEWVGDAYLYITATLLISQTFPALLPGKCSQLRERIVKNVQLAAYAKQYGFEERAQLPDDAASHKQGTERTKMLGDVFEAYIAAVILSDPDDGVARCTEWLKALWSMTLEKDIKAQEREGKLDSPMWRLRGAGEPVQLSASKNDQVLPAKDRLRKLICSPGIDITYRDCAPERKDASNKLPVFTVGVFLTGWGEKDKKLGFGSAHGKKDAGQKAAEMALANTKLVNAYAAKKKLFDAQRELERQALEGLT